MFEDFYQGKRVFITGHTGFKGSWLSEWLLLLGARPIGYGLCPQTEPALFNQLGLEERMEHQVGDVRDRERFADAVLSAQPDVVFHLAAQSLVRRSYAEPVETFETNVLGTIHLLDALRSLEKPCSVVIVTSDKCYENQEWLLGYRENDPLGGHDPYSSSKACAELAVQSFRRSFFAVEGTRPVALASARAGNVVGGGDWAQDRIMPDCIRALTQGKRIPIRNPGATRPWQHVLEPLSGYLLLGQLLFPGDTGLNRRMCGAYNFGPDVDSNRTVRSLVQKVCEYWPGEWEDQSAPQALHEAHLLSLSTDKAWHDLRWRPVWDFETTVRETVRWYREIIESRPDADGISDLTRNQIWAYCEQARHQSRQWACETLCSNRP
jgi:CDP-glucose 4,6-dehydratase